MRLRLWLVALLGLSFLVLVAGLLRPPAALAEPAAVTIVVNTTADEMSNDGHCSLREAIQSANTDTASGAAAGECPAGSGLVTIVISRDTFSLAIPPLGADDNTSGDLNITSDVVLSATAIPPGCFICFPPVVQGGAGWADRILNITGTAHVTIADVGQSNGVILVVDKVLLPG